MRITPITHPLPGEQVVEVSPADADEAAATWLRRPNLFPGRALTAPTLEARSRWAAGHIVLRGQAYAPGVVNGLEVGYTVTPASIPGARPKVSLHIAPGRGLAGSGEDLWIARSIEVDFFGLPVVAPPGLFSDGATPLQTTGTLSERAIGPRLGDLLTSNSAVLPPAGILVMQPVAVDAAAIDPDDPCDRCGCAEDNVSYEDWRLADAVRLLWYAWPTDLLSLPSAGPRFRNDLAYRIFDSERQLDSDAALPWEEFGVPVALIGVDAQYLPAFSDRGAVARNGGRARVSRLQLGERDGGQVLLAPRPRLAPLWQAQIEQLAGQIADLGNPAPDAPTLAHAFGRLPPCGLLPTNVLDLAGFRSGFFPASFDLDAVPVPVEQLDLAIREAAPMAPLDLSLGERVRVLVPVSQASWEPRLLKTETIDPLFQQTLDAYLLKRSRALGARQGLRIGAATLRKAIDGTTPAVPAIGDDPDALETESLAPWGPPPASGGHRAALMAGLHQHFFHQAVATPFTPAAGDSLYAWVYLDPDNPPQTLMLQWRVGTSWEHRAYWGANLVGWGSDGTESRLRAGDLPTPGQWLRISVPAASVGVAGQALNGMAFTLFDGRAAYGPSGRLTGTTETPWFGSHPPADAQLLGDYAWDFLTANALAAPFEPGFGLTEVVGNPAGESVAIRSLLDGGALGNLSTHERGQLTVRGLQGFIDYLTSRTNRADDIIDYGFVKVQTDIYRVRQLILDTTAATRLAVSPTLAGIAQSETAIASQQRISTFFDQLKGVKSSSSAPRSLPTVASVAATKSLDMAAAPTRSMTAAVRAAAKISLGGTAGSIESSDTPIKATAAASSGVFSSGDTIGNLTPAKGTVGKVAAMGLANLALDTGIDAIVKQQPTYTAVDIANTSPLVGSVAIRSLSIAERLAQPKALETRDYSSSSRQEAVNRLLTLADTLRSEDSEANNQPGPTSGLFGDLTMFGAKGDPFLEAADLNVRHRPFADFIDPVKRGPLLSLMLHAPLHLDAANNPVEADESLHFSDATDTADTTVALLRQMEGRVRLFRDAIAACQQALASLQSDYARALSSASAWGERLAEARHDVAVTRALIAEEQARLDAINARRKAVLAAEVRFLAFMRPRDADTLMTPPLRSIDPGLIELAVPACLRSHPDVPDELAAMLAVVRDAPAAWFGQGIAWFDGLDRVDLLVKTVQATQLRTQIAAAIAKPAAPVASGLATTIAQITAKHLQVVSLARSAALQIDPVRLSALTWQGAFQQVIHVVSLGDLISGEHGRGAVSKRAADFYHHFSEVCACLHAGFSDVLPAIRLGWAMQLSEYDSAPNLRNLASLPRWSEIEYIDRKRMQSFADWLFSQASASEARAQDLVNDVVRMCLLLASHAPVDRIISGRLPRPVTARPGLRIPLIPIDASKLRVGMQAVVYSANQIVARALVEDVGGAEISARVVQTSAASVELNETMRVQFADPASISFAALPVLTTA